MASSLVVRATIALAFGSVATLGLSGCFESTDIDEDTTTSSDGNDESEGETGTTADCGTYCSLVSACDDSFPQYTTVGPCMSVCSNMPLGSADDQTGNTVGCRTFYSIQAGEATANQETFCQNAGPSGNGVCGGLCESFCAIAVDTCTGDNQVFDDTIDCINKCMTWDTSVPYASDTAEADNYACRLKHLTYATLDPGTHCSHVADESNVCVDATP